MGSKINIDTNNQFSIDGVVAGTYDVIFSQDSWGQALQGSLNLASLTKGGVVVTQSQTLDLGTITLQPGLSISGLVTDQAGNPLPNIRIHADSANRQAGQSGQEAITNSNGKFTISGLNPATKVYDFTAAPRPHPEETVQPVPYGQVKRSAVDVTQVPPPNLTFVLPPATAGFTGKVVTADGNALAFPVGSRAGYPVAAIFVNQQGSNSSDNPLGDENNTNLDGRFNITNMPAGVYDLLIQSSVYRPLKLTGVTLASTLKDLGTITMQKGPTLQATLAKPDGSPVNTNTVQTAVAVSPDLGSIIFGQIKSDARTATILSITFAGFELSPKAYTVLLFDQRDNIVVPQEGKNLQFTTNSDNVSRALTYQPTAPAALLHAQKSGTGVLLTYYFSRPLRNGPGDQTPSAWLTLSSGQGQLSGILLSGDRRQLQVIYTPPVGEPDATVQFSARTVDINPATGVEFAITKTVALLLGQKATSERSINPALGGGVSLGDALDPAQMSIPGNAFFNTDA